ncbi:PorP/SprF family type IX secretion system membrane protein [Flexithrix dorotheae]|uniref:PorP/SprF family type IX secretion system membrane protein n=1 Tax=Flexithrix dorotheae TaxID=70993 RepID=UPI00035C46C0|nr:type IX secretion system membrane protein PorP/SprF [Flexithrix dorotheae]
MKKKIFLWLIGISLSVAGFGQQQFQLSQYMNAPGMYNPAFMGVENFTDVKLGLRQQWSGLANAPATNYAYISTVLESESKRKLRNTHIPDDPDQAAEVIVFPKNALRISDPELFKFLVKDSIERAIEELNAELHIEKFEAEKKHGFGGSLHTDRYGEFSQFGAQLAYAYHIPLNRKMEMSFGVSGMFSRNRLDKFSVSNPDEDELYQAYLNGSTDETFFHANAGVLIYSRKFYGGYSAMNFATIAGNNNLNYSEESAETQHVILAGFNIDAVRDLLIIPGVLYQIKTISPSEVNFNVKCVYREKYMAGVYYRNQDAIAFMTGIWLKNALRIGYSYDYTISELSMHQSGSHELTVGIKLGKSSVMSPLIW